MGTETEAGGDRLQRALARGDLWRAKEILQGRIGSSPYDPELYRRYGELLFELQDRVEAGRYRPREQEEARYAAAIDLFLGRHRTLIDLYKGYG